MVHDYDKCALPSFLWGSCPRPPVWLGLVFASGCDGTAWRWHTGAPLRASQPLAGGYAALWELRHLQEPSDGEGDTNRHSVLRTTTRKKHKNCKYWHKQAVTVQMVKSLLHQSLFNTDIQYYITIQVYIFKLHVRDPAISHRCFKLFLLIRLLYRMNRWTGNFMRSQNFMNLIQ